MDAFFQPSEAVDVPVTIQKKKRKVEDKKDDNDEIKQKAKLYCKCTEQWKVISKYNPEKLKTWVDEKEFDQIKALHETIFSFATRVIGFGLDKLCMAEDYVNKEIQNDISLRESIEIECANWVQFLSNRFKIIAYWRRYRQWKIETDKGK